MMFDSSRHHKKVNKDEREQEDDGVVIVENQQERMKQREAPVTENKVTEMANPKVENPKMENSKVELPKVAENSKAENLKVESPKKDQEVSSKKLVCAAPKPQQQRRFGRKFLQLLFVGGLASLLGGGLYHLYQIPSAATSSSRLVTHIALIFPVLSPPATEPMTCITDNAQVPTVVEQLRVVPCVSSGSGRVIPRLNRSDYATVKSLLLESGHNLLEGLPENGLTTLALEILANGSYPSMYIDFRQFTNFEVLISERFGLKTQAHLYDALKAMGKMLQERSAAGLLPILMVFDHFEVALRNSQFQAERFFTWVFDMEHKSLLRAKFLSSDAKLATAMRELVKWKLSPVEVPAVSKSDVRAYLANVTVLDPKAIERVAVHGTNMGIISRIAAQYLRANDAKTSNASLDECLKRLTPRSDFLAHLGNFAWAQ